MHYFALNRWRQTGPMFAPTHTFTKSEKIILWVCFYVSVCLILRMWLREKKERFGKKVFWSLVLLLPVIGWVFYGAFYRPLSSGNVSSSSEADVS